MDDDDATTDGGVHGDEQREGLPPAPADGPDGAAADGSDGAAADEADAAVPGASSRRGRPAGGRAGVARHGMLRARRAWPTLVTGVAAVVAVALVSAGSVAAIAAASLTTSVETVHLGPTTKAAPSGPEAFAGAFDFVVVGSDTRAGQVEAAAGDPGTYNNDVTMLVHVSADHQQLTAVSIPRDLVTDLPACKNSDSGQTEPATRAMFNEALSRGGTAGGLSCVVDSVANLTGIQAQFAGLVKFDGVAAMSNAVGGVPVCIATPIHDREVGLDLDAGEQTIQGAEASAFLRTRKGIADGSDLGRISNQQVFLSALARKVTAPGGALSNPVTLYTLAHAALSNMIVSDNLRDAKTMVSLALTLKGMDLSHMLFVQYPTGADPDNAARVVAVPEAAHALNEALQHDTPTNLDASSTGIGVGAPSSSGTASGGDGQDAASSAPSGGVPGSSGEPSAGASTRPPSTALPSQITGQTADEATCSNAG